MTRVMLDTSAYSAFMRGHPEIKLAFQRAEEIYLNPIILGELLAGFARGKHTRKNERELRTFLTSPRVELVDVNEETAERYAVILDSLWRAGTPIPTNDIWIAASAMQYGLHVLTTDAHYQKVTQVIVDYVGPSRLEE
ncbi:MAG: type II toxin-antitoxin system VapC family toxin [Candidatus Rokubacteria bacterium]|nr:type II toxin-antitoxin system VapC family toxin [Candidatus Rokubacteria bacterium]